MNKSSKGKSSIEVLDEAIFLVGGGVGETGFTSSLQVLTTEDIIFDISSNPSDDEEVFLFFLFGDFFTEQTL